MLSVKINDLTELHDVRFCAAFMPVRCITLCMERGNIHKVSEAVASEIAGWVSIEHLILSCGTDTETVTEISHLAQSQNFDIEVKLVMPYSKMLQAIPHPIQAAVIDIEVEANQVKLWVKEVVDLANELEVLEIQCPAEIQAWQMDALSDVFRLADNVFMNIDETGLKILSELSYQPYGVAVRRLVEQNFQRLDFDKFDAFIEELENITP